MSDEDDTTSIYVLIIIFLLTISIIAFVGFYFTNKSKLLAQIKSLSIDYKNIRYALGTIEDDINIVGQTVHHVINDVEDTIKNVEKVIGKIEDDVTDVSNTISGLVTPLVNSVNGVNSKIDELKRTISNC